MTRTGGTCTFERGEDVTTNLLFRFSFGMDFKTQEIEFSPIKRVQAEAEREGAIEGRTSFVPPIGGGQSALLPEEDG